VPRIEPSIPGASSSNKILIIRPQSASPTIAWAADTAGRSPERCQLTPFAVGGRLVNRRVDHAYDGFEWDERKSAQTLRERGLSFDDAALVFKDASRLDDQDERKNYGEIRNIAIGFVRGHGLLYVVCGRRAGMFDGSSPSGAPSRMNGKHMKTSSEGKTVYRSWEDILKNAGKRKNFDVSRNTTDAEIRRQSIEDNDPREEDLRGERFPGAGVIVTALRERFGLSQEEFAARFGIPANILKAWEEKRRYLDGPAMILLRIIADEPDAVARAIATRPSALSTLVPHPEYRDQDA